MNDRVGQQFGKYRLSRLLGQGGFAEVYLGEHIYLKTQAALKLLHGRLSEQDTQEFLQEAQTLAKLKHPYIVRVYDFGLEQHIPYIVMDYAPNGTLHDRHPRGTMVPLPQILSYVRQVGAALAYTHERRLIHRDVKPENMLLDEQNQIQLSDFGIAAMAHRTASMQIQTITGTVRYMAPEQLLGLPTPASDQYSLGILVYEWLCGESPFHGATFVEIGMKHATAPVPSLQQKVPTLIPEVEQVVLKALAKDEKQRFLHIQDFVQALEHAAQSRYVATTFLPPEKILQSSQALPAPDAPPLPPTQAFEPTLPASPLLSPPGAGASSLPTPVSDPPTTPVVPQGQRIPNPLLPTIKASGSARPTSLIVRVLGRKAIQFQQTNDRAIVKDLQKRLKNWTPDQVCPFHKDTKRCSFDQQERLIHIHLCKLGLTEVPLEVGKLLSLQTLVMSDNQLTSLPAELGKLSSLKSLEVKGNPLHTLPSDIIGYTAAILPYLRASQQENATSAIHHQSLSLIWPSQMANDFVLVMDLQKRLSNWTPDQSCYHGFKHCIHDEQGRLIHLHLCGLKLSQIPSEVWSFTSLQHIFVSNNQLTSLPAEIGALSALRRLYVDDNRLTSLPPELGQLSALETFELKGNPLRTPPPAIIKQGTAAILAYLRALPQQHSAE